MEFRIIKDGSGWLVKTKSTSLWVMDLDSAFEEIESLDAVRLDDIADFEGDCQFENDHQEGR